MVCDFYVLEFSRADVVNDASCADPAPDLCHHSVWLRRQGFSEELAEKNYKRKPLGVRNDIGQFSVCHALSLSLKLLLFSLFDIHWDCLATPLDYPDVLVFNMHRFVICNCNQRFIAPLRHFRPGSVSSLTRERFSGACGTHQIILANGL